jgi:hypothetical protein
MRGALHRGKHWRLRKPDGWGTGPLRPPTCCTLIERQHSAGIRAASPALNENLVSLSQNSVSSRKSSAVQRRIVRPWPKEQDRRRRAERLRSHELSQDSVGEQMESEIGAACFYRAAKELNLGGGQPSSIPSEVLIRAGPNLSSEIDHLEVLCSESRSARCRSSEDWGHVLWQRLGYALHIEAVVAS